MNCSSIFEVVTELRAKCVYKILKTDQKNDRRESQTMHQDSIKWHPWHMLTNEEEKLLFTGENNRYPNRQVRPFARRSDNDDVACFVDHDPDQKLTQILIIHDFASEGYEVVARLETFSEWVL